MLQDRASSALLVSATWFCQQSKNRFISQGRITLIRLMSPNANLLLYNEKYGKNHNRKADDNQKVVLTPPTPHFFRLWQIKEPKNKVRKTFRKK